ncbi:CobW family GTP-binding protein [Mucilaginibacter sp. SP1R1]|uniref:CobW family GTP-binding protein n=1 Tax=Mucilaginibacter sp. SP1R1 TaxID=2723091 RepID=UPI0016214F1D|nr:GTP-binding protein [Mucilaginibacter sp. SP1R1]MBB6151489.1 G3E family GTPase [Mucilaginibacter sp. SP1R1]
MTTTNPKQVTIITGFLGAGKTTFLNALIAYKKKYKLAVIENEYGQEGIDGELVIGADKNLFELNNGCLCCTLNDDFYSLLEVLWNGKEDFDELVIETTGIANPASVAAPFLTNASVPYYYKLKLVICLVDARNVEQQLSETEEARNQISFSDILLITKTDTVEADEIMRLQKLLRAINPFAVVLSGNHDRYPFDEIFNTPRKAVIQVNLPSKKTGTFAVQHQRHQHHDLVSLSFNFKEPFDLQLLSHRLTVFLNFQAKDVYRVKGIFNVYNYPQKLIIQSVMNDLAIKPGEDWAPGTEKNSRIVFIGKNLQANGFEKLLKQCFHRYN